MRACCACGSGGNGVKFHRERRGHGGGKVPGDRDNRQRGRDHEGKTETAPPTAIEGMIGKLTVCASARSASC